MKTKLPRVLLERRFVAVGKRVRNDQRWQVLTTRNNVDRDTRLGDGWAQLPEAQQLKVAREVRDLGEKVEKVERKLGETVSCKLVHFKGSPANSFRPSASGPTYECPLRSLGWSSHLTTFWDRLDSAAPRAHQECTRWRLGPRPPCYEHRPLGTILDVRTVPRKIRRAKACLAKPATLFDPLLPPTVPTPHIFSTLAPSPLD